jgi:hypothetical protein
MAHDRFDTLGMEVDRDAVTAALDDHDAGV